MTIPYKLNPLGKNNINIPISQWGSQWNDPIIWENIPNYITSANGRKFARHPSNMGTVMSMNDGTDRNVLILDAQYRGRGIWGSGSYSRDYYCMWTIGFVDGDPKGLPFSGWSDEALNSSYSTIANQDIYTSIENTNFMMNVNSDAQYLAGYCRSKTILHDGIEIGCDAPNLNTVVRLYAEMIQLDSMDPTVSNYSGYSLSEWFPILGDYKACWSSSLRSASNTYYMYWNSGTDFRYANDVSFVPILEL